MPSRPSLLSLALGAILALGSSLPATAQNLLPTPGALRPLQTANDVRGFEAVGRLDTGVSFCSGTLITPELVLTAAHCLFGADGTRIADDRLRFAASLRNDRAQAVRGISESFIPVSYIRDRGRSATFDTVSEDMALLVLDQPVETANISPLPAGRPGRISDLVTVVSYGRDRADYASIEEGCEILAAQRPVQVLSCTVVEGSSGAPILRETGAGFEIVAVVSAVGQWDDEDATIAVSVETLLPELLAAYEATQEGLFGRSTGTVRRLGEGDGGRSTSGARFTRP